MKPGPVIELDALILELLRRVAEEKTPASKLLSEAFTHWRGLGPGARAKVAGSLYGVLGQLRRIDHTLDFQATGLPGDLEDAARLAAWRLLDGQWTLAEAGAALQGIDWAAVARRAQALEREPDPVRRLAVGASLPDFLAERLVLQYGAEADALGRSLGERALQTVRVNLLKGTREEVLASLSAAGIEARPTALAASGIAFPEFVELFRLPQFAGGALEVQDEGSQLVAELVAPPPKGLVIDYCAGAGGKALAIGALLRNQGRLIAVDVHDRRLLEFKRRAIRAGLSNWRTILLPDPEGWPPELEAFLGQAQRVLADVPCSGVGSFRRKPEQRWRLQREDLERLPQVQERIARSAMRLCAPGGRLIYATCTLLAEENERVVERLLDDPAFEAVSIKEILGGERARQLGDEQGRYLKLLPHRQGTDGFFAAVLRRRRVGGGEARSPEGGPPQVGKALE